jgi:hypothetical protein
VVVVDTDFGTASLRAVFFTVFVSITLELLLPSQSLIAPARRFASYRCSQIDCVRRFRQDAAKSLKNLIILLFHFKFSTSCGDPKWFLGIWECVVICADSVATSPNPIILTHCTFRILLVVACT